MKRYSFKMVLVLIAVLFLNIPFVYADTAEQYLSAGNDNFNLSNFDQAIVYYTKAIEINPNLAKAYDNRGVAYAQEGSLKRAIADFTMAIANNPKDPEAYNNRGHVYFVEGNLPQAVFDYTRAIDFNTFYVKAYNNRSLAYYKLKEYSRAWSDVQMVEVIGGTVDPNFIKDVKKALGKDQ